MKTNTPCFKAFKEEYPDLIEYLKFKGDKVYSDDKLVQLSIKMFFSGYNAALKAQNN